MMKKDFRTNRTIHMIQNALVQLINDRGFQKVTVSDIIKLAHINRSTFYAHYQDKYDLLDQLKHEVYIEINGIVKRHDLAPTMDFASEQVIDYTYQMFNDLAKFLYTNRPLMLALMKTDDFYEQLKQTVISEVKSLRENYHIKIRAVIPEDYTDELIANSMLDLIIYWIKKPHPESPQEFAQIMTKSRQLIPFKLLEMDD